MYPAVFLSINEELDNATTPEKVLRALENAGANTDQEKARYLCEYTKGTTASSSFRIDLYGYQCYVQLLVIEFLDGSWREKTNKFFLLELIKKGVTITD